MHEAKALQDVLRCAPAGFMGRSLSNEMRALKEAPGNRDVRNDTLLVGVAQVRRPHRIQGDLGRATNFQNDLRIQEPR